MACSSFIFPVLTPSAPRSQRCSSQARLCQLPPRQHARQRGGQRQLRGGAADTDADILPEGQGGDPPRLRRVPEAPVLVAQGEDHVGGFAGGECDLLEGSELPEHRPQAPEAYVELGHGGAGARSDVGDPEGDGGGGPGAAGVQIRELELRVGEAEAERKGGGHILGVVPAVANKYVLGKVRDHLLAPAVVRAEAGVLPLGEAVLVDLRKRHRQPAAGRGGPGEEASDGRADLLTGLEEQ
mmetsp:Transcript_41753/g.106258  ORF Transcript_41753/g.106258 Transcript_41753/m.106258 type:complete len:240 (-) Transcript_41753:1372-2091(-)